MRMMKGRRKRRWICEGVVGAAAPLAAGKREAEERREGLMRGLEGGGLERERDVG